MDLGDLKKMAEGVLDKDHNGLDLNDLKNLDLNDLKGLDVKGLNTKGFDISKLLTNEFLKQNTKFGSTKELHNSLGLVSLADLAKVEMSKLDSHVKSNSGFGSLAEMLLKAKLHM